MKKEVKKPIQVFLTEAELEALSAKVKASGFTRNVYVRNLIRKDIKK